MSETTNIISTSEITEPLLDISIIIPIYETEQEDLIRLFNSIYYKNSNQSRYEVICIDDNSPSDRAVNFIKDYTQKNNISNLRIVRHSLNKRQGGARNTGFKEAKGKFVCCIDQDDFYSDNAVERLLKICNTHNQSDIIMVDFATCDSKCKIKEYDYYVANSSENMSGPEFLHKNEIAWMPWGYIFNREYLLQNKLQFVENVRFEDADFVMDCIAHSKSIVYVPQIIVCHRETELQTSCMGYSIEKNEDFIKMSQRVGMLADRLKAEGNPGWEIILKQHQYMYKSSLKRNIWRLPYHNRVKILNDYSLVNYMTKI